MIKRFYANNFRSLVNFEYRPSDVDILCGDNGTGKSSVFDAMQFLCGLATGKVMFDNAETTDGRFVSRLEHTSWVNDPVQKFEIDIVSSGHEFSYKLQLEQLEHHLPRVISETAVCDGREMYARDLDGVHFDNGRSGFHADWQQAVLPMIQSVPERKEIEILQNSFKRIVTVRPNTHGCIMSGETRSESVSLSLYMSNFASWYRWLAQDQEYAEALRDSLKYVWEDIRFLALEDAGLAKIMSIKFEGLPDPLMFDKLSDGERMLVCLYALHTALDLDKMDTVLIDEPDNFVSLRELQPWLLEIAGDTDDEHQVLLITHSGELLNAGVGRKVLLTRENHHAATQIGQMSYAGDLTPSEALARGWAEVKR